MAKTKAKTEFDRRLGRCYELAGRYALGFDDRPPMRDTGRTLVHGSIQGFGNPRIGHAWVIEPDGSVWEPVTRQVWDPDLFRRFHHARVDREYPAEEAAELAVRSRHWGPWDSEDGP